MSKPSIISDEVGRAFVEKLLAMHPFVEQSHWATTLISILSKTNYQIYRSQLEKPPSDVGSLGYLGMIQNHLGTKTLEHIEKHVGVWVDNEGDVTSLDGKSTDLEDSIVVLENGGETKPIAYVGTAVEIESAASDKQTSWGSW